MRSERYSLPQIGLHWIIALLFLANYLISEGMGSYLDDHLAGLDLSGNWVVNFHVYAGIAFLAFAVIRLVTRLIQKTPEQAESGDPRLNRLAKAAHHSLYLLMFLVPVAGLLTWYGQLEILAEVHVLLMNLMLAIIGLHIAAALYHQLILKDGLLHRMSFLKR